ncbi:MAG: hypothetical protein WDM81_03405 [Rhizomicrobium sp.]
MKHRFCSGLRAPGKGTQAKILQEKRGLPQLSTGRHAARRGEGGDGARQEGRGAAHQGRTRPRRDRHRHHRGALRPVGLRQGRRIRRLSPAPSRRRRPSTPCSPRGPRRSSSSSNSRSTTRCCCSGWSSASRKAASCRSDDTPETLAHRLEVYYRNTAPLLDYYGKQGKVVTVDGMLPIAEVTKAIAAALDAKSH